MRSSITSLILLAITLPAHAQDNKTKPNTLTPKEIADGWILLFDGETTFGWKGDSEDKLPKVAEGVLIPSGTCYFSSAMEDFDVHLEYKLDMGKGHVGLYKSPFLDFSSLPRATAWTSIVLRVRKTSLVMEGPGIKRSENLPNIFSGKIAFIQEEGSNLTLRNVKLKPLNTVSLFNGKNLAGWREFPGKKSTFSVTDQGELNVKNGPGDLQTVGKYQDFILQLECISHGKHLNSGIFFRCKDNEYQNGYEAQILNKFTPEATQIYLIESYDPMTHKLLEKKKIQSTAVDYGTGAIYRRQPARKEMSKDGEWFTMTIVAHGNHMATWVNGVQVTDWYDNRPKSDNARTGCRLEAGHISIQGHDPTTNLSFRNLRIAAWPN